MVQINETPLAEEKDAFISLVQGRYGNNVEIVILKQIFFFEFMSWAIFMKLF